MGPTAAWGAGKLSIFGRRRVRKEGLEVALEFLATWDLSFFSL